MNSLDKQYQDLLQAILDYGVEKQDRTGTGTKSIFGYTFRHKMSDGFPILTTKKMAWKTIVTELLWFLRGDTNIKYLVDNGCHIWDGDAYKNYCNAYPDVEKTFQYEGSNIEVRKMTQEEFIEQIKTDDDFAKKWGELGPIYGKQWRSWHTSWDIVEDKSREAGVRRIENGIDQIQNLINDLKTNPDSRRLLVSAWNISDLPKMILPPCHYGFQVYTRELTARERTALGSNGSTRLYDSIKEENYTTVDADDVMHTVCDDRGVPRRAISLMWNQRSVDTFLGLPFNITSYGLLLEILAKEVNMVPDELIGNLGDTHLYLNHIEQAKEQIGRDLTRDERIELASTDIHFDPFDFGVGIQASDESIHNVCDLYGVPRRSRQPFELPKLLINDEFWNPNQGFLEQIEYIDIHDFPFDNYQSHPTIKAPLSN